MVFTQVKGFGLLVIERAQDKWSWKGYKKKSDNRLRNINQVN